MPDDPVPVARLLIESQRHRVHHRIRTLLPRMHLLRGLGLEDAHAAQLAIVQVRHHETRHVRRSRGHAPRRIGLHELEPLGRLRCHAVARRHQAFQRVWQRLREGCPVHAKRLHHVRGCILHERLAGQPFHNIAGKRRRVVGIRRHLAGLKDLGRQMFHQIASQRAHFFFRRHKQLADRFLKPRRMRHDVAHREARRNLEVQILVDVMIQIELALLNHLHHARPDKQLRDRAWPKERRIRTHALLRRHVGIAVALLNNHPAILDHRHHGSSNAAPFNGRRNQSVKKGFQIGRRQPLRLSKQGCHY